MAKTSDKQTFIMSKTWLTTMDALPDAALNKLTRAIIAYQMGNEVVIDDPVIEAIFKGYREFFIENEKKYKEQCERNSQIAKDRSKNNEPSPAVTSRDESSPFVTHNDTDSDTDSDNGFDADKESLTGHKKHRRVYAEDPELDQAIRDFIEHRNKLKRPMTDHAVDLLVGKLNKITIDPVEQIALINTAIEHGWQTVYEPKEKPRSGTPPDKYALIDAWAKEAT